MKSCIVASKIALALTSVSLVWAGALATPGEVCADGQAMAAQTYIVQEGAYPWFDRTNWMLTKVPDSLKGTGPVPQESCASRSLVIAGTPTSILIGVSNSDVAKFEANEPAAKATADTIGVKNAAGSEIDYTIFSLQNPPANIDGSGVYVAGLILLKITPAPAK